MKGLSKATKVLVLGVLVGMASVDVALANSSVAAQAISGDTMVIDGREVRLYGAIAPHPNQQCHTDNISWSCGRDAWRALKRLTHNSGTDRIARRSRDSWTTVSGLNHFSRPGKSAS